MAPSDNFFHAAAIFFYFCKKMQKMKIVYRCSLPYEEVLEDIINPYSAGIDFSRQNLTSGDVRFDICRRQVLTTKVYPRTVRVKIFLMVLDP